MAEIEIVENLQMGDRQNPEADDSRTSLSSQQIPIYSQKVNTEGLQACISCFAVAAALFATVTYAAQVLPPANHNSTAFYVFYFANQLTFLSSLYVLAAVLFLTANIDDRRCINWDSTKLNHIYNYGDNQANINTFTRWSDVVFFIQNGVIVMYVSGLCAFMAATYAQVDTLLNKSARIMSIVFAALAVLITYLSAACVSRCGDHWRGNEVILPCCQGSGKR